MYLSWKYYSVTIMFQTPESWALCWLLNISTMAITIISFLSAIASTNSLSIKAYYFARWEIHYTYSHPYCITESQLQEVYSAIEESLTHLPHKPLGREYREKVVSNLYMHLSIPSLSLSN